ncbi:MAG: beta-lactamase family protein [Rhodothermales bacterium]|nr:beta-lactamase family protein [Rhodothermales bacterium]MBO6778065.1 beta-lactamase family protein [Rhodothermales bacterium]
MRPARFLLSVLILSAASSAHAQDWASVEREHQRLIASSGIVGSTLALVEGGAVTQRQDLGWAVVDKRPVDIQTLFHWASITKTFTGVAVMQLRDRGLISLEDPIVEYVPELRQAHNPFGSMQDITVGHLMAHAAGFRGSTWPWDGGEDWQPWEPTAWSQLVAMMPYTDIAFEPGSRFQYSNPGIVFLGSMIEAVTGDVFEAYIEKNIFRPLGMRSAYFDVAPWHLAEHRSENYRLVEGSPVANGDFNTGITVSNGGLNATVDDLAKWIGFLTGAVDAPVLSRESLAEMWQEVVPVGEMELGHEGMGLTFWLYPDRGLVGHTGSQRGFFSFMLFDPEEGRGVLATFNTAGGDETGPDTRAVLNAVRLAAAEYLRE